jgi:hypothetical protein
MTKILKQRMVSLLKDVPSLVDLLKEQTPKLKWKHQFIQTGINVCETHFDGYDISIMETKDEDGDPKNYDLVVVKGEKRVCVSFEGSGKAAELYALIAKYTK